MVSPFKRSGFILHVSPTLPDPDVPPRADLKGSPGIEVPPGPEGSVWGVEGESGRIVGKKKSTLFCVVKRVRWTGQAHRLWSRRMSGRALPTRHPAKSFGGTPAVPASLLSSVLPEGQVLFLTTTTTPSTGNWMNLGWVVSPGRLDRHRMDEDGRGGGEPDPSFESGSRRDDTLRSV